MPNLSIKNIPTELYRRLKQSAKRSHRSLNKEAVARIEIGLENPPERSPEEVRRIIERARKLRQKLEKEGGRLSNEEILASINRGRR